MRVGAYTDYPYRSVDGELTADRAFAVFLNRVGRSLGGLTLLGRFDPSGPGLRHGVAPDFGFFPLPHYETLARPQEVIASAGASMRQFWRALDELDCVWVMGPHPIATSFVILAWLRRKRAILGVRQDWVAYVRHRHPRSPLLRLAAHLLEWAFRTLGRFTGVVAVGPDLARRYRHSRRVLEIAVSLVDEDDLTTPEQAALRPYGGELTLLTVGRLDAEKNPLLIADVFAGLRERDSRWRLIVCGEGPMEDALAARLRKLGVDGDAELRGYVPFGPQLMDAYRSSHAFLHVSWTEGFPQVLLEAFAAAVPVVATDVGGVRAAVGDAARLIPPGDPEAAIAELTRLVEEADLRASLISSACRYVASRTIAREADRVAAFITAPR